LPVTLFAALATQVFSLFLLLLLLLLLPLLWVLGFNMCNIRDRGFIEELVHGVKYATGWHHQSNLVFVRFAEASPGNIVEDFIVLLKIPASQYLISFLTI
jgi:hypothetical protein